jgi:putative ABC transport system permease protein
MERNNTPLWQRYGRVWGPDARSDVDDEIAFHVQERIDDLVARGVDPRVAREEAMRGFGDLERVKATCLDLAQQRQATMKRQEQLVVLWQDVVYGLRQMRSQKLLTAAALLTLAVGIGATTSLFSVVNAVLLRPLPYADSDRIVTIYETVGDGDNNRGRASNPHFRDWTQQSQTLESTGAWVSRTYNITGDGEPERVVGAMVSPGWFEVLKMQPELGRFLQPGEDGNTAKVAVLSYDLWQSRYAGARDVVGRDIVLNNESFTIVGVAPRAYRMTEFDEQVWTPLYVPPPESESYGSHFLFVMGKLKPGVTLEVAQADLARVTEDIRRRQPNEMVNRGVEVSLFREDAFGALRTQLLVLLGAVGFVLLIACGNVASLLLARATTRRKEIAIRAALGGSRGRLMRQLLTESVVLAIIGGALGVGFAAVGVRTLVAAAPQGVPRIQNAGLQGDVLLFALAATLLCGLLFGIAPALRATRTNLQTTLRESGRTSKGSGTRDRLRSLVVVGEIAGALVLVVGAGLFIRSATRLQSVSIGFEPDRVLMARVSLPADRYGEQGVPAATFGRMLAELRAQPGVATAAFGTRVPMWGGSTDIGLTLRNFPREPANTQVAHVRLISDGYFETLGVPLLQGRMLQPSDMQAGAPPVVLMNETLARQAFGDANPIGQLVTGWNGEGNAEVWREVVGVVGDTRSFGRAGDLQPELFFPYTNGPPSAWNAFQRSATFIARGDGNNEVLGNVRNAVRAIDSSLPLFDVRMMSDVVALNMAGQRFNMMLLSLLGLTALLLAAVGIYGVVGFFVMQRTQEIGVRMALGATTGDVLRLVLSHGGKLTVLGITIGALASFAVTRVLANANMLFEIGPRDPAAFIAGAVILGGAATVAAFVPARRAARLQPVKSLSGV